MTEDQIKAAIVYANQIDPRIQMNGPTLDVWTRVLHAQDPAAVHAAIGVYHERPYTGFGQRPVLEPSTIKRIIQQENERATARQAAIESAPAPRRPQPKVKRTETPEWKAAVVQGAVDHLGDLVRRGIITTDQQGRLDHYRATGEYKRPTDGRGI